MRLAALVVLAAVGVCGCSVPAPEGTYAGDTNLGAVTKLPDRWQRYDTDEATSAPVGAFGAVFPGGLQIVAFTSPGQSSTDLFTASTEPTGWLLRRDLRPGEDVISAIRNSVYPIDVGLKDGSVIIVGSPTPITRDGLSGETITYDIIADPGPIRVRIAGVADTATRRLYVLAVGCGAACHTDNQSAVDGIYASWRIFG
jgi:hypothetical protein